MVADLIEIGRVASVIVTEKLTEMGKKTTEITTIIEDLMSMKSKSILVTMIGADTQEDPVIMETHMEETESKIKTMKGDIAEKNTRTGNSFKMKSDS